MSAPSSTAQKGLEWQDKSIPPPIVETVSTASPNNITRTLVLDSAGNIVYPSYVPPETRPPRNTPGDGASSQPGGATKQPAGAQQAPTQSTGAPEEAEAADEITVNAHDLGRKPPLDASKQCPARVPQPMPSGEDTGLPPQRAGRPVRDEEPPSSSESSSDEGDENNQAPTDDGARRKKQKMAGRKAEDEQDEDRYRRFHISNEHYLTKGRVSKRDGRLNISLHDISNTGYLAKALGTAARKIVPLTKTPTPEDEAEQDELPERKAPLQNKPEPKPNPKQPPRLNIVIMIIGSRGDLQPFLRIASLLSTTYHHRVRIATHPAFRETVSSTCPGVEFFSVGGDPSELMSFMVKNPGMIPTLESVKAGDVGRRRQAMRGMFEGFWRACCSTATTTEEGGGEPFVADAIIANPPGFAHVHCAEALGVPLHLMFTFPYTPTQAFPHPLARVRKSNVEEGYTNWISYPLVEMMVWQGLGDLVNEFRVRTLGLDPVSTLWAPGSLYRLRVPFTYLWSPSLVPKPADWGDEVDVAGFVFVDLASSFEPPEELVKFLEEGDEPPVYIGFGSIVVDDPDQFTRMIFEAVKLAGVRALVSKGWGGLGGDSLDVPPEVFLLDNTPHDWLFPRVRACVIHGGAGTTAIALKCGKPTMIVPFFGDQNFWGAMVGNAGAGPQPVPYKHLSVEKLADGIKYCITEKAKKEAERIARDIERDGDGAEKACQAFHRGLALQGERSMRCSILPERVAVWQLKSTGLQLSALAAEILAEKGLISRKKLRLLRHIEWNDFEGPGEPLTGAVGSLMTSVGNIFGGVGGVPYRIGKSVKKRREKKKRQKLKGAGAGSGDGNHQAESKPDGPLQHPVDYQDGPDGIRRRSTGSTGATNLAEDAVHQVGDGAAKSASALARTPVDLALALAQGFHNSPYLFDIDVRRPTRVTGIRSGLRAARREFVYGVYDGWTGVVRLPVRGAREEGMCGFFSGVGMGLTGFVLKNIAAIIGPVAYTLQGVVKQCERSRQQVKHIRQARAMQGQREVSALPGNGRKEKAEEVVAGWRLMRQLWEEMKRAERKRETGLRGRFHGSARRLRQSKGRNVVFENVDVAQRAIEALRMGNGLDSVLQMDRAGATGGSDKSAGDMVSLGVEDRTPQSSLDYDSASGISDDDVAMRPAPDTGGLEDDNPFSADNKTGTGRA